MRHMLTMAVGVGSAVRIRYYALELAVGDIMMLSSDGLHGVVSKERIEQILGDMKPRSKRPARNWWMQHTTPEVRITSLWF